MLVTRALSLAGPRDAVRLPTRSETPIVALRSFLKTTSVVDVAMTFCARDTADVNRAAHAVHLGARIINVCMYNSKLNQ